MNVPNPNSQNNGLNPKAEPNLNNQINQAPVQNASAGNVPSGSQNQQPQISKEETIGYHKGSINTLIAERAELLKIVGITENLIQAHAQELQKLGVNIVPEQQQPRENSGSSLKTN